MVGIRNKTIWLLRQIKNEELDAESVLKELLFYLSEEAVEDFIETHYGV